VIHTLLDLKITNVLSLCHDKTILASVQSIIGKARGRKGSRLGPVHYWYGEGEEEKRQAA
jgi:hypothetical protein